MPEIDIHQGDDGFGDYQSLPSSHEGEIDSDDVGRSVEPQVEEDVRNSGKKLDGGVTPDLPPISIDKVFLFGYVEMLAAVPLCNFIHEVLVLLVLVCSYSFSEELYVNQPANLHEKISEMRIVETPLHSVRSVAQDGTRVFSVARHDFLLLRTAGDKWYKAEKHMPSSGQAGIHFYRLIGPGIAITEHRSSISVDFSLEHAFFNLSDHGLAYIYIWGVQDYLKSAHSQVEAMTNLCSEIVSDDDVCNALKTLEKGFENLIDPQHRIPNKVLDIVESWNILWGILPCFLVVFGRFWLGFCMDWNRRPTFFHEKGCKYYSLVAMAYYFDPNPIFFTYNLTWLATTYLWHFNFLSFFGYYVGWTVFLRGVESWVLELEKHSEDPCLKTAVSGREDHEFSIFRANSSQGDSMVDQRKKRPSPTLLFGLVILLFVTTFEQALGYSVIMVCLRWFLVLCGLRATKGSCSMPDLHGEVLRYMSRSWKRREL